MTIPPQPCLPGLGTVISSFTNIMVIPVVHGFLHSKIFSSKYVTVTLAGLCLLNTESEVTVTAPLFG